MIIADIISVLCFLICVSWVEIQASNDEMRHTHTEQDIPEELCQNGNGEDYSGFVNKTKSGLTCQKWTSQSFQNDGHHYDKLGDHNYCRNPQTLPNGDIASGVWCYTTDPTDPVTGWEYCDIPMCVGSDTCPTTDARDCIFPFSWKFNDNFNYDTYEYDNVTIKTFNGCTNYRDDEAILWCATKDDDWAYCEKECREDIDYECHTNLLPPKLQFHGHSCDKDQEKYCKISKSNTMCKYCGLDMKACGKAVCHLGITDKEEIKEIVNHHNKLRRKVANGKEKNGTTGGQPPAANMNSVEWDPEIARMAQTWANQCDSVNPHDKNRNIAQGVDGYCGQNAFWMGDSPYWGHPLEKFLGTAVQAWYDEVKGFDKAAVSSYGSGKHKGEVGHYTQVVFADVTKIGCGYMQRWDGDYFSETIKCNYFPGGNWEGMPIYEIGKPGSNCSKGRKNEDGLCVPE